jgi:tellurite methyltransferase
MATGERFRSAVTSGHVRHPPQFSTGRGRSRQGTNEKIGERRNCVKCIRFEMPDDFVVCPKTAEFNEQTYTGEFSQDRLREAELE